MLEIVCLHCIALHRIAWSVCLCIFACEEKSFSVYMFFECLHILHYLYIICISCTCLSVTVKPSSGDEEEAAIDKLFPKALEGFIMVLTKEGDLVYLSEDIQKHLGLSQVI